MRQSIDILKSAQEYLRVDHKCQNEVSRLLRSLLPCPLIHFEWTIEALVGFHLMEPFLGIMLDLHPCPTHSQLRIIFQNLYEQMMNPIEGLKFSSIHQHALPALSDGFFRTYKKSWMNSFRQHLAQYDLERVESAVRTVMKTLAATLSRQRGIQYEFGPEYAEYSAKKATGEQGQPHLRPLSEIFSLEQLDEIPVDNKVGENYFGEMTVQLRAKGGSSFKAIGERLVLSSNSDLAFSEGAEKMLANKELKAKKKEIEKIEAEWSKAQKDITKAKVSTTDELADTLAREQSKNKLLAQCIENGGKFKNAPVTSQDDVKLMFAKIQKLKEEDKLVLMRKEIKFKKSFFQSAPQTSSCSSSSTSLPPKCFRISWHCMQWIQPIKNQSQWRTCMKSLMPLPPSLQSIAQKPAERNRAQHKLARSLLLIWNGLRRKRSLLLLWRQMDGASAVSSHMMKHTKLSPHISLSQ